MITYVFSKDNLDFGSSQIQKYDVGLIQKKRGDRCDVFFLRLSQVCQLPMSGIQIFDISETGDDHSNKVCDRCFKFLNTIEMFANNRIKKHSITKRPSCKKCRKIKDGISVSSELRNEWNLKAPKRYDLFTCPICTKTTISGISKIVLDHNHQTGEVRGYLCESCNTGIGRFDDDPELIKKAIKWLKT